MTLSSLHITSRLQDQITASLSVLASAQSSHLLSALGLFSLAPLLTPGEGDGTPLSTVPGQFLKFLSYV